MEGGTAGEKAYHVGELVGVLLQVVDEHFLQVGPREARVALHAELLAQQQQLFVGVALQEILELRNMPRCRHPANGSGVCFPLRSVVEKLVLCRSLLLAACSPSPDPTMQGTPRMGG